LPEGKITERVVRHPETELHSDETTVVSLHLRVVKQNSKKCIHQASIQVNSDLNNRGQKNEFQSRYYF